MPCQLCHSNKSVLIGTKKTDRFVECESTFVRCEECQLIRIEPIPTSEELDHLYKNYIYKYHINDPNRFVRRYKTKLLPLKYLARGKAFLDIGCNVGAATAAAKELGFDSYGIDVSPSAIEYAQKIWPDCNYSLETLEDFAKKGKKFDVIHCTEVIEHIPNLDEFMKSLVSVLNSGALLFFTTPDTGHFRVPKDLIAWKETRPLEHVSIFNQTNIRTLFERYKIVPFFFMPMLRANMRFYSRFKP
jgi:2-polyprenyl-3-methyl-5-hydroxy-6-metoxy-1,4-benzoquinol methylase